MRSNIYDTKTKNVTENVTENVLNVLPPNASNLLTQYTRKKRSTAEQLMLLIHGKCDVTAVDMAQHVSADVRTVKRYLKEFQDAGVLRREGSDTQGIWILS